MDRTESRPASDRLLAIVDVEHAFYGAAPVPIQFAPADPNEAQRSGWSLHESNGTTTIMATASSGRPDTVTLDFTPTNRVFTLVTAFPDGALLPADLVTAQIGPQDDTLAFASFTVAAGLGDLGNGRAGRLTLALPRDGTLRITLRFDAAAPIWVYHVLGAPDTARVLDPDGRHRFRDLGQTSTVGGRALLSFVSETGIAIDGHGGPHFTLVDTAAKGNALIVRLPNVGPHDIALQAVSPGAAPVAVAEIYVTL